MKIMVSDRPISVLHHAEKAYRPNRAGEFEIEDHHVDGVRPHGLVLKEEAEAKKSARAGAKGAGDLVAENAALKRANSEGSARLVTLNAEIIQLKTEAGEYSRDIAALKARIAELEEPKA